MKLNTPRPPIHTHEGAVAKHINAEQQLRRSVMSCLLWESDFYEDGKEIAHRIRETIPKVNAKKVSEIAIEAREKMKLRHVPLLIVREMSRITGYKTLVRPTLARIIQRADELSEFLSIYWKDKRQPLSKQVRLGLADAFQKFNEYALAKYNRLDAKVKLRDVLFLCHAKPKDKDQEALWKRLIDNQLAPAGTWEEELSKIGTLDLKPEEKAEERIKVWTRLMAEKKLGALALLRNLRNMLKDNVAKSTIRDVLKVMKTERVLPFRFISAARYAPDFEPELEKAMFKCLEGATKLPGHTVLLIDVSGSMNSNLSGRSEMKRLDAAYGLAMLLREVCDEVDIFSFSEQFLKIPARRGFALRDAIDQSQIHSGTPLGQAITCVFAEKDKRIEESRLRLAYHRGGDTYVGQGLKPDRLIVITDEQAGDQVPDPKCKGYMVNVASATNGVGYGPWLHVDGFSEAIVDYIVYFESDTDKA